MGSREAKWEGRHPLWSIWGLWFISGSSQESPQNIRHDGPQIPPPLSSLRLLCSAETSDNQRFLKVDFRTAESVGEHRFYVDFTRGVGSCSPNVCSLVACFFAGMVSAGPVVVRFSDSRFFQSLFHRLDEVSVD